MKAETVIAIVTAGIALITSAVSFSYNLIQNKRNRTQKVILENRIKYLYAIREGFAEFIGLINADAIDAAKANSDIMKAFFPALSGGYEKIKTYLKPFYEIEKSLIDSLDKVYFLVLAALNGKPADSEELNRYREELTDKYLKYDWAYWKYIQRQKEGNFMNSDDAFDSVYDDFVKSLK